EDLPSVDKETRDRLVSVKVSITVSAAFLRVAQVDGLDEPGKYRQEVYELFSETGKVCEVYVPMARAFGSPHYMFVRYSTTEEAETAVFLRSHGVLVFEASLAPEIHSRLLNLWPRLWSTALARLLPRHPVISLAPLSPWQASLSLNGRTVGGWPIRCSLAKRSFGSPATPGPSM
ncbi:hypothetical protein FOZ63_015902, partial [Perkinsus olseni]